MSRFKLLREAAGLKQEEAANVLNIGQTTISAWEVGNALPRAGLLPKIAEVYNCTPDEIMDAISAAKKQTSS